MAQEVHLSDIREQLSELSFPLSRDEAASELADVTVLYADGEEPMVDVIERITTTQFASVDELESDILANAPVEAIGEPGQSEGDA